MHLSCKIYCLFRERSSPPTSHAFKAIRFNFDKSRRFLSTPFEPIIASDGYSIAACPSKNQVLPQRPFSGWLVGFPVAPITVVSGERWLPARIMSHRYLRNAGRQINFIRVM